MGQLEKNNYEVQICAKLNRIKDSKFILDSFSEYNIILILLKKDSTRYLIKFKEIITIYFRKVFCQYI